MTRSILATAIVLSLAACGGTTNEEASARQEAAPAPVEAPASAARPATAEPAAAAATDPDQVPRHPSQLYQAGLEGLALLVVMAWFGRQERYRARRGFLGGLFLAGYAVARMIGELFRQPDAFLGFLPGGITMGQVLSLPMLAVGLWAIATSRARSVR